MTNENKQILAKEYVEKTYGKDLAFSGAISDVEAGINLAESHYQCIIDVLKQRIENLTNQIGEIIGGVPFGSPYIMKN
jgi:hypothetical protein